MSHKVDSQTVENIYQHGQCRQMLDATCERRPSLGLSRDIGRRRHRKARHRGCFLRSIHHIESPTCTLFTNLQSPSNSIDRSTADHEQEHRRTDSWEAEHLSSAPISPSYQLCCAPICRLFRRLVQDPVIFSSNFQFSNTSSQVHHCNQLLITNKCNWCIWVWLFLRHTGGSHTAKNLNTISPLGISTPSRKGWRRRVQIGANIKTKGICICMLDVKHFQGSISSERNSCWRTRESPNSTAHVQIGRIPTTSGWCLPAS